jgi:predicted DCC family thiol-disulfide oxidoreductase YuxK
MKVIYFDGVCGLCNGFVDYILKADKTRIFHFSPLQSEYARAHLPPGFTEDMKSVIYQSEGKILSKSDAVIEVLSEIGGFWRLIKFGRIFPLAMRDSAYNLVAENRYKLFGKKETCRIPTPEERARFVI